MDPTTILTSVFNYVLPLLPAQWAAAASVIGSFIVSSCALAAYFWPRPKDGSKWLALYQIVNGLGLNGKHASNADDEAVKAKPPT